jgi:hypothetical protein
VLDVCCQKIGYFGNSVPACSQRCKLSSCIMSAWWKTFQYLTMNSVFFCVTQN